MTTPLAPNCPALAGLTFRRFFLGFFLHILFWTLFSPFVISPRLLLAFLDFSPSALSLTFLLSLLGIPVQKAYAYIHHILCSMHGELGIAVV
jgi:hypothetical protein